MAQQVQVQIKPIPINFCEAETGKLIYKKSLSYIPRKSEMITVDDDAYLITDVSHGFRRSQEIGVLEDGSVVRVFVQKVAQKADQS